jgi:pilus assembly protein CpaC
MVSCQSTQPLPAKVAEAHPASAPLPAWTTAKGSGGIENGRNVKFATKVIEVSHLDGEARPTKNYRKSMDRPELNDYLRSLMNQKGCDLMTLPSITTREGQSANARVGRDFVYPESAGDSPKLKKEFVGVVNYVRARPSADGRKLKVDVLAQVSEFEGFDASKAGVEQPVFAVRQAVSSVELAHGESIVIGGVMGEDQQEVEDKVPFLGDIPLFGHAFRTRQTNTIWRELIVVVTPTVLE